MEISNRSIYRVLTATTVYVGLLWLAYVLRTQLIWIGTAVFLALAINPLVDRLSHRVPKKRRGVAAGLLFLLFIIIFGLAVYWLIPPLARQTQVLVQNLPSYADKLQNSDTLVGELLRNYDLSSRLKADQSEILRYLSASSGPVVKFLHGFFSGAVATITVLALTFFLLVEGPTWIERFWRYLPAKRRQHYQPLAKQMYQVITGYVTGNLLITFIAGIATAIMLTIVGVPYAIPLGILVGVIDLLPLIGATLAAVIVVTVCLFTSVTSAIVMAIFFLVYQQLENHVLQPLVYGRTVQLSPLMVLISAILGVAAAGILGALVAIPIAACLQILARDYVKNHF